MILEIINNNSKKERAYTKARFPTVTLFMLFSIVTFNSSAHSVMFSKYELKYKENKWIISFQQKTSQLRDAIYAKRPDLRDRNLNSKDFLDETSQYIIENIRLSYNGNQLIINPETLHYGGLKFAGQFSLESLPKEPDYLNIKIDGYEFHEHSINTMSIFLGNDGYVEYFNKDENSMFFSFKEKQFISSEVMASSQGFSNSSYVLIAFIVLGFTILLYFISKQILLKVL